MESAFQVEENQLSFKEIDHGQQDGVQLTEQEKMYLLPHFIMMLIGKPGSGKTTLLKQLLTNEQMYYKKFDHVILVSPSHAKMDLKLKKENVASSFSLDWLFKKIDEINEKQLENVFGKKMDQDYKNPKGKREPRTLIGTALLGDNKSRFVMSDMYKTTPASVNVANALGKGNGPQKKLTPSEEAQKQKELYDSYMQSKYKEMKELPPQQVEHSRKNVLIVLDDVVGAIKKAEFDPRLAQLFMNRRHLIINCTISIIVVSQKYTLIPTRIRSNASWVIFYQLNPRDLETVYGDIVVLMPKMWRQIVGFVFGKLAVQDFDEKLKQKENKENQEPEEEKKNDHEQQEQQQGTENKNKTFNNLGIWVESNKYFKNFKRINI